MKHYTILKLKPGADAVEVQQKIRKAYDKLDGELDWANHPVVYRACEESAESANVMAVIELDGVERLAELPANPHYAKLTEKLQDVVAERITFDHY